MDNVMVECKICGTSVVSSDIANKGICIGCMEDYERISTLLSDKPKAAVYKSINTLNIGVDYIDRIMSVRVILNDYNEDTTVEVYIAFESLYSIRSYEDIFNCIERDMFSLCKTMGYNPVEVMQKIFNMCVLNSTVHSYLGVFKSTGSHKAIALIKTTLDKKIVSRDDKAVVKLPKAIVVSKSPLEVFVGNLLDKYCK